MFSVNPLYTALAGGGQNHALRPCLQLRLFLFAVFSTVYQQNSISLYCLHKVLILDSNFKAKFAKKTNINGRFQDNLKFIQRLITGLSLSLLWIYSLILLSGDVHTNPGPNSASSDSMPNDHNIASYFNQNLSIMHLNIQSLLPKLEILEAEMQQYDIVVFTESWLNPNISNNDIRIANFDPPYKKDRDNRIGGGVAIYVRTGITSTRRDDMIHGDIEAICIEVSIRNHNLLLCGIYRPPNSGLNYWDLIENTLDNISNSPITDTIIVGDFNCDIKAANLSNKMHILCNSYNYHQLIDEPTNYTEHSSTIIDLLLVSKPENVIYSGVSSPFIPDLIRYHCPTVLVLKYRKLIQKSFKRNIWLYERGDYIKYRNALSNIDWDAILNLDNVDECATRLTETIISTAKECIPNKNVLIRPSEPKWITSFIKKQIRQRHRLYKSAKRKNTVHIWQRFRQKRNEVTAIIRQAKVDYINKLADDLLKSDCNSKSWYKVSSEFLVSKNKQQTTPYLETNNEIIESDADKAEVLNKFFVQQSTLDDANANLPEFVPPDHEPLNTLVITNEDIIAAIKLLKPSKAPGPDLISPKLLKEGAFQLIDPLRKVFTLSIEQKKFPSDWKYANVTAIPKKEKATTPGDHRPISLLNYCGKLMERCIHKHVTRYLKQYSIITPFQSGFQTGDSTVNQLLHMYNDFAKALDEGKEVRVVFLDISKAFDKVWHKGLIFKLQSIGISGNLLEWFTDYLANRKQRVCLNGHASSWKTPNAGVPQGSILGPLLFIIYINDIVNHIRTNIRLFADDTTLYEIIDDPLLTGININIDLRTIMSWAKTWLVMFNSIKTESFIASKKRIKPYHPPLFMDNTAVNEVTSHKHLGLTFSNDLTWTSHIKTIIGKATRRLGCLRRHKFLLDRKSLKKMYTTFILPLLEYGNIIWDNCSLENSKAIENIQLDAARIITGATKVCSIQKIYDESGLDTLQNRRTRQKLCQLYKIINDLTPLYLRTILPERVQQQSRYRLRNSNNFSIPIARTTTYYKSFLPATLRSWNSLDEAVKQSPTISSFKRNIARPNENVPQYYETIQLSRKSQILHTRLRLECSSLNHHLFKKNLIDSPLCACGQAETSAHFLLKCPRYDNLRQRYFSVLRRPLTISYLLNGIPEENNDVNNTLFKQVQLYITATKRFS